ncbi:conserved hypothetical protein [uncultured Eubacteriales bacterium]|uniref:Uncharacterized protein n=1 Tax=uncultured Eubacteriales bacterium TaxID=172733 RepID=A0A212JAH4_9FIRM|nr:conserved hypothetical protein [uncultured Eubacteriales bacterium]
MLEKTSDNERMHGIHDRMSVVLRGDALRTWTSDTDAALDILQAVPPELVYERA